MSSAAPSIAFPASTQGYASTSAAALADTSVSGSPARAPGSSLAAGGAGPTGALSGRISPSGSQASLASLANRYQRRVRKDSDADARSEASSIAESTSGGLPVSESGSPSSVVEMHNGQLRARKVSGTRAGSSSGSRPPSLLISSRPSAPELGDVIARQAGDGADGRRQAGGAISHAMQPTLSSASGTSNLAASRPHAEHDRAYLALQAMLDANSASASASDGSSPQQPSHASRKGGDKTKGKGKLKVSGALEEVQHRDEDPAAALREQRLGYSSDARPGAHEMAQEVRREDESVAEELMEQVRRESERARREREEAHEREQEAKTAGGGSSGISLLSSGSARLLNEDFAKRHPHEPPRGEDTAGAQGHTGSYVVRRRRKLGSKARAELEEAEARKDGWTYAGTSSSTSAGTSAGERRFQSQFQRDRTAVRQAVAGFVERSRKTRLRMQQRELRRRPFIDRATEVGVLLASRYYPPGGRLGRAARRHAMEREEGEHEMERFYQYSSKSSNATAPPVPLPRLAVVRQPRQGVVLTLRLDAHCGGSLARAQVGLEELVEGVLDALEERLLSKLGPLQLLTRPAMGATRRLLLHPHAIAAAAAEQQAESSEEGSAQAKAEAKAVARPASWIVGGGAYAMVLGRIGLGPAVAATRSGSSKKEEDDDDDNDEDEDDEQYEDSSNMTTRMISTAVELGLRASTLLRPFLS